MTRVALPVQRRITVRGLMLFFCILLGLVWLMQWSDASRKLDRLLHDGWVRLYQRAVPEDVVIAAIDSRSLAALGRWPWPRTIQAELMQQLSVFGARAVIVDLLYVEPSQNALHDEQLAEAIAALPVSILPVLTEGGRSGLASESLPIPVLTRQVTDLGHVFLPIDDDGIVRRIFLKAGINQSHWPALSLAALTALEGSPDPVPGRVIRHSGTEGRWVVNHEVLIPFYGPNGTFRRVSAADIVQGNVPRDQLRGKIVFLGMSTSGLGDVVPTPVSALDQPVPGVEIHANVFSALRDGSLVTQIHTAVNLLIALILLPVMLLLYTRAPPRWALLSAVVGATLPVVLSFLLYRYARLWYAPLSASLPLLGSYLLWSWHRLEYVNRFLQRESDKLQAFLPLPDSHSQSTGQLVDFFNSAQRHLPIQGWRFAVQGQVFSGGSGLPEHHVEGAEGSWRVRRGVHARHYAGRQPLNIEIAIADPAYGRDITQYVNDLAQVRAWNSPTKSSSSIERLQSSALKLSEQMDGVRTMKQFSDTVLDGSPLGFAVWNAAGECIRANSLMYSMITGFPERGELVDFLDSIGEPVELAERGRRLESLMLETRPWQITHSGESRELVVNFSVVGETLSERLICVSVLDVTEIRTAEQVRAEMVEYLSHDLRSPLISAMYLLEQHQEPRIEQHIQHSLDMMDDLLHVARADNLSEVSFSSVLLNAVLDNALDHMLPQAVSKQIQFEVDSLDDELWLDGDAASLERAFVNILSNAVKYSPQHSTVSVSLSRENAQAVLTVDDQGIGIDPAILDQLFTRFRRDEKVAGQFKGIGLGLALVSRVVTLHGGSVAASNTEEGTRIRMFLPLEESVMLIQA